MNILRIIDEIEQLVENSSGGFMGKRLVNEEEFFTKIQQLRSALPKSMKEAEDNARAASQLAGSASLQEVLVSAEGLSNADKLALIARLSGDLARCS